MSFGWNLHRLRELKRDTIFNITSALGINQEKYISWEADEDEPDFSELCQLADYFMITVDNILDAAFDYTNYLCLVRVKGLLG